MSNKYIIRSQHYYRPLSDNIADMLMFDAFVYDLNFLFQSIHVRIDRVALFAFARDNLCATSKVSWFGFNSILLLSI